MVGFEKIVHFPFLLNLFIFLTTMVSEYCVQCESVKLKIV